MLKTCEICGKRFTACRSSARYCGERCRRTAKNEAQRKARAEAKWANVRWCAVCGERIPPELDGNRIYCSEKCQHEGARRKHRQWDMTPKGRDSKRRASARRSSKPATAKATDVYTPDDAARARADVINEFRRLTAARSY